MNFKRLLKFTLSGLLLTATATAYAEGEEPKVVQLSDKDNTAVSWTEFANAINNPSSITGTPDSTKLHDAKITFWTALQNQTAKAEALATAEKAYNDAEELLKSWQTERDQLTSDQADAQEEIRLAEKNTETQIIGWLDQAYTNAKAFQTAWLNDDDGNGTAATLWYKATTSKGKIKLYLAFTKPEENGWDTFTEGTFYQYVSKPTNKINNVFIYFGKTDGNFNYIPNPAPATPDGMYMVSNYMYSSTLDGNANTDNQENIIKIVVNEITTLTKEERYLTYTNQDVRDALELKLSGIKDKKAAVVKKNK